MSWKGGGSWGGQQKQWGSQGSSWGGKEQSSWGSKGGKGDNQQSSWGGSQQAAAAPWKQGGSANSIITKPGGSANSIITKPQQAAKGAAKGIAAPAANLAAVKAKVTKMTSELAGAEKLANTALDMAKKLLENEKATAPSLKASVESLEKHKAKLMELQQTFAKELVEAKKAGPSSTASVGDITKLVDKVKNLIQQVSMLVNKIKPKATKAQQETESKVREAKDTNAFKPILAKITKDVSAIEVTVLSIEKKAAPFLATPPEGEELDKAAAGVETLASEAAKKIAAAKNELNDKSRAIASYAPETKKSASASLQEFRKKLEDATRKCSVYQSFKKELPKLIASQEALKEVSEKYEGHDKPITNATKLADMSKIDKEKLDAIDNLVDPVRKAIREASALIGQKSKGVDASTQAKFTELKKKGEEMEKKIQAVYTKIKKQRDVIRSEDFVGIAAEKLEKAEEAWKGCQEAEMPFLTGVEVLPGEQNDAALKACAEAIASTSLAVNDARGYIKARLSEVKGMEKDLCDKLTPELTPFSAKIQTVESNLSKFKKEHAERKVIAIMMGALESVDTLEKKFEDVETQTKALGSDILEDATVESINEAVEKAKAVLSDVTTSMSEAKKVVTEKQREAKAPANDPASAGIQTRLSAAQEKITKLRNAVGFADKLVRAKKAITLGEEKMSEAESEVEKVQKFEGSTFTADSVKAFGEAYTTASNAIKTAGGAFQQYVKDAPPKAKEALQGLADRKTKAAEVIEKLKAGTKDAREEVLADVYLEDAETSTKATETAAEQMEAAEGPFVVGGDIPLAESLETIKKCEEASVAVKKAIREAETMIKDKSNAVKQFGAAASKKAKEGFSSKSERVKAVQTKLVSFEKDLKDRTKSAKMAEAGVKVDEIEALLKKTVAAAEPFTKEALGAEMSEADAEAPLKAFMECDKELSKALTHAKSFVNARIGEQKTSKENTESLKKLQERLAKVAEELVPAKKATKPHEQKALGKQMLAEAKEQVGGLDAEIKKAADVCAPLLEKGGAEYLVESSIKILVKALQAHMKEKELTQEKLFEDVPKSETKFVAYLKALPEALSHDELNAFSDERRKEIFARVSGGGKSLTLEQFTGLFQQSYTCAKEVVLTDKLATEGAETICKVEVGTAVTILGPQSHDNAGLVRAEAQVGDKKGFITLFQKGTRGAPTYLTKQTPWGTFINGVWKALKDAESAVQTVSNSVASKSKTSPGDEAPMKAAREEIAKLKEKITEAQKSMKELKQKVETANTEFKNKEKSEANAHIEARNLKEAAPFLTEPQAKLDEVLAAETSAEEAAAPLKELTGDDLLAFATPASVMEAIEKVNAGIGEKATAAKEAIKEQLKAVSEVNPQTGGTREAIKLLKQMEGKVAAATRNASKLLATVKTKCASIVNPKLDSTSVAIRKYSMKNSLSGEALFDKFKDGDKIDDAGFCKLVESLEDVSLSAEVARLICQKIGKDGIGKDAFLNYVVVYYKVTKTIAFTDSVDISSCKTLRKAAIGEVIEMLEGPVTDEASGVTRIKAKATKEPICEGWVTLAGNQGSEFLEKTKKP